METLIITDTIISGSMPIDIMFLKEVPFEIILLEEKEDNKKYVELYNKLNNDISGDDSDNEDTVNKPEFIDDIFLNMSDAEIINFIMQNL